MEIVLPILFLLEFVEAKKQKSKLDAEVENAYTSAGFKTMNILPETYDRPVDFLTIGRRGFGDIGFKEPIDLLELDMIRPLNAQHARELKLKNGVRNIQWFKTVSDPPKFLSARDEMLYYKTKIEDTKAIKGTNKTYDATPPKNNDPKVYDLPALLEKNLAYPYQQSRIQERRGINTTYTRNQENNYYILKESTRSNDSYFRPHSFQIKPNLDRNKLNWTTCDEFARGALFHPNDVVNTDWLPFYIWSKRKLRTAFIHKFTHPTKKLVQYFKTTYGPYIKEMDWNQPKLHLKEMREMLLVAGDRKGLFYGIVNQDLPDSIKDTNYTLPLVTLRMKIKNPYLGLIYCDELYGTIMAERGTEPVSAKDKEIEAGILNFHGTGRPAYRDIEREQFVAKLKEDKKREAESRKLIKVGNNVGGFEARIGYLKDVIPQRLRVRQ